LLGYYADDGKLACRPRGTGMPVKLLADLRRRLDPLARKSSPLSVAPPRSTRFGSPLVLSRVHWVEPKFVAEITYLTWTADNLLRHTVYLGLREDKPATDVRREDTTMGRSANSGIILQKRRMTCALRQQDCHREQNCHSSAGPLPLRALVAGQETSNVENHVVTNLSCSKIDLDV
jgi:ATP dependent DNA ligase C terminal region